MRYIIPLALAFVLASNAYAAEKKFYKSFSGGGDGNSMTAEIELNDGTKKQITYPSYPLLDGNTACMKIFSSIDQTRRIRDLQIKQALGMPLAKTESEILVSLAADSKIYKENLEKMTPVCKVPPSGVLSILTSAGVGTDSCSRLSKAEIDAAPYIEQDNSIGRTFSVEGETPTYRFKVPKEERKKLLHQNIELLIKWNEIQ